MDAVARWKGGGGAGQRCGSCLGGCRPLAPTCIALASLAPPRHDPHPPTQDCAWAGSADVSCSETERYPGVWEVPLWILPDEAGTSAAGFSMDPTAATPVSGQYSSMYSSMYSRTKFVQQHVAGSLEQRCVPQQAQRGPLGSCLLAWL